MPQGIDRPDRWHGPRLVVGRHFAASSLWFGLCLLAPAYSAAQERPIQVSTFFDARVVSTSNAGLDNQGQLQPDVVIELQPSIKFDLRGPRVTLGAQAQLTALKYVEQTQEARLLPRARLDLASRLVDNLLFFDGFYRVDPTFEDPFATRPEAATSYKLEPRTRYSLSPYLSRKFTQQDSVLAKVEFSGSRVTPYTAPGSPSAPPVYGRGIDGVLRLVREPLPLGWTLEATATDSRGHVGDEPEQRTYLNEQSRGIVTYAASPQYTMGAIAGRERVELLGTVTTSNRTGLRLEARPTERTLLTTEVEKRFFGYGWDLQFSHRTPFLSLTASLLRQPAAERAAGSSIGTGQDISAALDAILTKQGVSANERRLAVQNIMQRYNLPQFASEAIDVLTTTPELRQSANLTLGLSGVRNFVYVSYAILKLQPLKVSALTITPFDAAASRQDVFWVSWNHRFGAQTASNAVVEHYRTVGLNAGSDREIQQLAFRLSLTHNLTSKSSVTVGVRRLAVSAVSGTTTAADAAGETAFYAGVHHQF